MVLSQMGLFFLLRDNTPLPLIWQIMQYCLNRSLVSSRLYLANEDIHSVKIIKKSKNKKIANFNFQ